MKNKKKLIRKQKQVKKLLKRKFQMNEHEG